MVGNEEGNGHFCSSVPGVCRWPQCGRIWASRASILKCRNSALEGKPRANDADAKDQAAAEATAEAGFYDTLRSSPVPVARTVYTPPSSVLPDRMVHGKPTQRHHRPEVVDGES
jgi:hypothetical protein